MKIRVTIDAQSFEVEVGDLHTLPIPVNVDGDTFLVMPHENEEEPPDSPSTPVAVQAPLRGVGAPSPSVKNVLAPIPGVILSVAIKEGDSVRFGQELCILEAMKMKNVIRASRDGKIGAVHIAAGDQVRHGQTLMDYSD